MKTIAILIILAATASAQLGKTVHQSGVKYGGFKVGILVSTTRKDNCVIQAVDESRQIVAITYRMVEKPPGYKARQMTAHELDRYLGHNKEAGAWEKTGPHTWKHVRERKSALYVPEDNILYVWKDLYATADSWTERIAWWRQRGFDDEDEIEDYEFIRDTICKKEP